MQRKKLGNWTVFAVSVVLSLGTLSTTAFSQELDDTSSGDSLVSSAVAQTDETYSVSPILSAYEGADIFFDVKREMRAYPCISYVMNKGLMVGMDQGGFAPSASMSRGQFSYLLYKMEGMPKTTAVSSFSDVDPNAYYADALSWAVSEALFAGYGNQTVQPESSISREEMAVILFRYAQSKGFDTTQQALLASYQDSQEAAENALDAVSWALAHQMLPTNGTTLLPKEAATRADCATMIMRFCEAYLPDAFPTVGIRANAQSITVLSSSPSDGTFAIEIKDLVSTLPAKKVEVAVWSQADQSDRFTYTAQLENGAYVAKASVANHQFHFGTYQVQVFVTLSNQMRLPAGTSQAEIAGSPAQIRLNSALQKVYAQAGRDLYSCYRYVVDHTSYQSLPIPLTPPEGYTADQWYALLALEEQQGNCFCYAAAFYHLALGLGYDARFVEGKVAMARGGYGPHGWVEITIDGATYICDPDMQDEAPSRNFYMQPADHPVIQYVR